MRGVTSVALSNGRQQLARCGHPERSDLGLGPIFLDLLGLQLTTSEIIIDLTAVPGPGNLLGNLLCALVGLLDQTPLDVGLINQLLAVINNLLGQF